MVEETPRRGVSPLTRECAHEHEPQFFPLARWQPLLAPCSFYLRHFHSLRLLSSWTVAGGNKLFMV